MNEQQSLEFAIWHSVKDQSDLETQSTRINTRIQSLYSTAFGRISVPADGNCFFSSLSYLIYGNVDRHAEVRQAVCAWLRDHGSFELDNGACLSSFVDANSWEEYCDSLSCLKTWADHVVVIAAAHVWKREIQIISSIPEDRFFVRIRCPMPDASPPFRLVHWHERHFEPIAEIPMDLAPLLSTPSHPPEMTLVSTMVLPTPQPPVLKPAVMKTQMVFKPATRSGAYDPTAGWLRNRAYRHRLPEQHTSSHHHHHPHHHPH